MKKAIIIDGFSTIHVGNGVLLDNSFEILEKIFGKNNVKILSGDPETCSLKYDKSKVSSHYFESFWPKKPLVKKILWISLLFIEFLLQLINNLTFKVAPERLSFTSHRRKTLSSLNDFEYCVSINGEMINDTFVIRMYCWLYFFWLCSIKGKKLVVFPQSFGPLKYTLSKFLVKKSLRKAKLIVARDKIYSYELADNLFEKESNVIYSPDVGFIQKSKTSLPEDIASFINKSDKKVIGVTISKIVSEIKTSVNYLDEIHKSLNYLSADDYRFLIMPSNYVKDGISEDYEISMKLKSMLEDKFEVYILENRPYFPDEFQAIQETLLFLLTTRMHVGIIASAAYIPVISINTQRKIRGYMENIGLSKFVIEMNELNNMRELIDNMIGQREKVVNTLKQNINGKIVPEIDMFVDKLKKIN